MFDPPFTIGLKSDGTVVAVGGNKKGECNVSNWHNIGPVDKEKLKQELLKTQGICHFCRGKLGGLFTKKCKSCGKKV